jgi:site-specific DNA recombinase
MTKLTRCAIYTRKSSEEGLEQDFNSLHAQREACEAYIKSQKHEGWKLLPEAYDDGGISGGTMQRPALQRLLEEVKAKKVDTIVVYKVDRLTRSLADFARMVELFDAQGVSFVSVTQQFNTTTSMGRLTLNVLLSFAQFEREVTSERIRDKVKASKQKGMWMGGHVPFGYFVDQRKLVIHPGEAEIVRSIFREYVQLGTVALLIARLDKLGVTRPSAPAGDTAPPTNFGRGGLQTILANPLYIGKIRHGKVLYDGQHEGIVDPALWDAVQLQLQNNTQGPRWRNRVTEQSPLLGKLYDAEQRRFVSSHTIKHGRRYRFYISESLRRGPDPTGWRLPAKKIEVAVVESVRTVLRDATALSTAVIEAGDCADLLHPIIALAADAVTDWSSDRLIAELLTKAEVRSDLIRLSLNLDALLARAGEAAPKAITLQKDLPIRLKRRGIEMRLVINGVQKSQVAVDPHLVRTVAKGHVWFEDWLYGRIKGYKDIVARKGISASYAGDVMKLAFLSPSIVQDIIHGRQPEGVMVSHLTRVEDIPLRWEDQARQYGWK